MDVMDISALFGNAIDNAIEAVEKIDNPEQRLITLKVASHQQFLIIRLDNYDTSSLDLSTGQLPETSKQIRTTTDSVLRVWSMLPINTVAVSHLARKIIGFN